MPIAFTVDRVLQVDGARADGYRLTEFRVESPYLKDYDAIDDNHPVDWPARFDMSRWGILSAWNDRRRVGGSVIAFGSDDVGMLNGRDDLALIWDLRVAPDARGLGVGTALMDAVEEWARARGCSELGVETQNINVPACRFYQKQGFELREVHPGAYPDLPDEVQLIWYSRI